MENQALRGAAFAAAVVNAQAVTSVAPPTRYDVIPFPRQVRWQTMGCSDPDVQTSRPLLPCKMGFDTVTARQMRT